MIICTALGPSQGERGKPGDPCKATNRVQPDPINRSICNAWYACLPDPRVVSEPFTLSGGCVSCMARIERMRVGQMMYHAGV